MAPAAGIYGWSNGDGGVHFYRMAEPLRVARTNGIRAAVGQALDNDVCEEYDTILCHMLWDERNSQAWEKLARSGQHRLVFDIDDVMWEPDWAPFKKHYTPEVLQRVWRNIALAHVVTTPSPVIAEHVSRYNDNVHYCPNSVPEYLLRVNMSDRPMPTIGYQGSPSHEHDFEPHVLAGLLQFLDVRTDWVLHLWGPDMIDGGPPGRVFRTGWQNSVRQYYYSLSMDIGIGPLKRSPFNDGKSGLRAIEYAALGIPALLADEPPYRGWVIDCVTGYLIPPGESWFPYLEEIAGNPVLRRWMSDNARRVAADWTTERQFSRYWLPAWNSV